MLHGHDIAVKFITTTPTNHYRFCVGAPLGQQCKLVLKVMLHLTSLVGGHTVVVWNYVMFDLRAFHIHYLNQIHLCMQPDIKYKC